VRSGPPTLNCSDPTSTILFNCPVPTHDTASAMLTNTFIYRHPVLSRLNLFYVASSIDFVVRADA
jgi:hypothetical protein